MRIALLIMIVFWVFTLGSCSSSPEPVATGTMTSSKAVPKAAMDNVNPILTPAEEAAATSSTRVASESLTRLNQLLVAHEYEGYGLQYEEDGTIDLLSRVFSDPRVANRDIRLVYTGLKMSYDKKHRSLTVGGLTDVNAIVVYITKNVPARKYRPKPKLKPVVPAPVPKPSATPEPTLTPPPVLTAPPSTVPPVEPVPSDTPSVEPESSPSEVPKSSPPPIMSPEDQDLQAPPAEEIDSRL